MKFKLFVFILGMVLFSSLFAESISGTINSEKGTPIPLATVVLLESDLILITEEDGSFIFEDIENGEYTLLVIAPGFVEYQKQFFTSPNNLVITLEPEIIEMDLIIVKADTEDPVSIVNEGVTTKELELLPTRADPFHSLIYEEGILTKIDLSNGGRNSERSSSGPSFSGRFSVGQSNEVSVYGGDSDWNNYYYDYIRIPTNTHTFG